MTIRNFILNLAGGIVLAFGCSNIHAFAQVTEGGVIGLTLLLAHWTGISPAISSLVLNAGCFALGFRTFGKDFLLASTVACGSYSLFYAIFASFAPVFPSIVASPLLSAVVGAIFVGIGAGLCVRGGGAQSGDDAIAMSLSRRFHLPIQAVYLVSDLAVLLLSLTYIPVEKILYSLLTVLLSGQIIGLIQK